MEIHENGHRFVNYRRYSKLLHQPYDYANEGLLKHLVSWRLAESTNPITKYVMHFVEESLVYVYKYIEYLDNFRNYNWKNR
jgi:hypothetical protein